MKRYMKKALWLMALMILSIAMLTACGDAEEAGKAEKPEKSEVTEVAYDDMPEFVFMYTYTPENLDDDDSYSVTYICKNGDVFTINGSDTFDISMEDKIANHQNGTYKDIIKKTVPQDEVMERYKTFLTVINEKGYNLIEYPDAVPSVEAPSYNWFGTCFMEGEMRSVLLHSNSSMTDMSSSDERVNDLYKWIEDVKK